MKYALNRMNSRLMLGSALSILSVALMSTSVAAQETDNEEQDVIVVRGIRQSLESALDKKREADQILDAIDAEDIGKLPDTNVAESLQRITGVQINRDLGEGSEVSVRGFRQNRVEVNGQTQVGAGAGGDVTFSTIPSDAFKSLEVVKTPNADDVEGGIGATIRLVTRKPLDRKKFIASGSLSAQYADRAEDWSYNSNLFLSNAWEAGKWGDIGVLFNYTKTQRKVRQDELNVRGWEPVNGFNRDLDGNGIAGEAYTVNEDGIITALNDAAFVPLQTRVRIREQDRDLSSWNLGVQWQPNDDWDVYFNGILTQAEADDSIFQYTSSFNSALQNDPNNAGQMIRPVYQDPDGALINENQTVLSALLGQLRGNGRPQRGVNLNIAGNSAPYDREVGTFQIGAIYEGIEDLTIEVNYAIAHGEQVNDQFFTSSGVLFAEWPFGFYDFSTGTDLPSIVVLNREVQDGSGLGVTEATDENRADLLDLSTYNLGGGTFQLQNEKNNETALTVDFDQNISVGIFDSIEYGLRIASEDGKRNRFRFEDDSGDNIGIAGATFDELQAIYPGLIVEMPYDELFDGATGDMPRQWFALDGRYLSANQGAIFEETGIFANRLLDESWGFDVSRKTSALYGKANFSGGLEGLGWSYSGNVGVRYVQTDRTAIGVLDDGNTITPVSEDLKYDNWLPSANLSLGITEDTYLRFGAAKTMARPRTIDLAPLYNVQFFRDGGTGGNPFLQPEEVTQFDVSFEKYFGDANLFSVAYFYKDFADRIEDGSLTQCFGLPADQLPDDSPGDDGCALNENLIRLEVPANVGEATVQGLEVGYQQTFDFLPGPLNGLGLIANYTYVNVDGSENLSVSGLPLPVRELSENSYNIIGFYEKGGFSARAAYNWRDEFYDERTDSNFGAFAEPYGQLDASASYDFNKNVSLNLEALNITREAQRLYQETEERLYEYSVNDTRYVVTLRIRR